MEQFEDWDVEVTAVPYPNASQHEPLLPAKRPESLPDHTAASSSAQTSVVACESPPAAMPKNAVRQKHLLKNRMAQTNAKVTIGNLHSSHSAIQQKQEMGLEVQTAGQNSKQEVDREVLKTTLPKIPRLSSFKNPESTGAWSMTEFVEDYDCFIKEGVEREVEIIRCYRGPGEQQQHPETDDLDWKGIESVTNAETTADMLTGESDSDSRSYRFASSTYGQEDQPYIRASSDTQQRDVGVLTTDQRHQQLIHDSESKHFQDTPLVPKKKMKQKMKERRQSCYPQTIKSSKKEIVGDASQAKHTASFRDKSCNYNEYWRAYYRTWQGYYAAASQSYWQMYHRPVNWLTAYHANAVYFEELLRSDCGGGE